MPIFRYHCKQCGRHLELLLPRYDAAAVCPECGSAELEKEQTTVAAVTGGRAKPCGAAENCPAAGTHSCGCGCGCHGHRG